MSEKIDCPYCKKNQIEMFGVLENGLYKWQCLNCYKIFLRKSSGVK